AFVLPSFLMVMGLSALYLRFGGLPWMQGVFYGIGAAVIAIIGRSATKLVRLTLGGDRLLWAIFAFAAVVTAWTESEVVWLFVGGGLVALAVRTVPSAAFSLLPLALVTGLHGAAARATLWTSAGTSPRRVPSCSGAGSPSCPSCTAAWWSASTGSR